MKVLLAAPQSNDTILGTIGNHCVLALSRLGHSVTAFDFRQSQYLQSSAGSVVKKIAKKVLGNMQWRRYFTKSLEKDKMNHRLIEVAKECRPDVMLVLLGDTISGETMKEIKQLGIVTANWFHDTVLAPQRKEFVKLNSSYYDYFFTVDSEKILKHNEINSRYVTTIPLACNPEVHKKVTITEEEERKYRSKVSFIGTVKFERGAVLSRLTEYDLGVWGYWIEKNPLLEGCYRGKHIFGEEAVKIYNASDIVLDINEGNEHRSFYVTPRVFEVPASGAFLLTSNDAYLSDLYEIGKEIICYNNVDELTDLVRYYLEHQEERKEIAKRGQQRAYREHTYENRIKKIISIIEKNG